MNAIRDRKDSWLALLQYRHTPTEGVMSNPTQRLINVYADEDFGSCDCNFAVSSSGERCSKKYYNQEAES